MSKTLFIILNIIYFIFDYACIPLIWPEGVLFGFIPFQVFLYGIMGVLSALLWGIYFWHYFNKQTRYDDEGNVIKKGGKQA